jgi:hypothetical protein
VGEIFLPQIPLSGYSDGFRVRLLRSSLDKPSSSVSFLDSLVIFAYEKVVLESDRAERRA